MPKYTRKRNNTCRRKTFRKKAYQKKSHYQSRRLRGGTEYGNLPETFIGLSESALYAKVEEIIAAGTVNKVNIDGDTPLILALYKGKIDLIGKLLKSGADPNQSDIHGNSPLMICILAENGPEIVKLLLDAGANPNFQRKDGKTVMHLAYMLKNSEIIDILLKSGAKDLDPTQKLIAVVQGNGDTKRIQELINAGADVNVKDSRNTPLLHSAVENENFETVKLLIEASIDINSKDNMNLTALIYALISKQTDIAKYLIEYGADVNIKDDEGKTPLHYAIIEDDIDIINLILKEGIDINSVDNEGKTPLHYASSPTVKNMLLKLGANTTIRNKNGHTYDKGFQTRYNSKKQNYLMMGSIENNSHPELLFEPRFGVELEICIKLNNECCNGYGFNPDLILESSWFDLFQHYTKTYLKNANPDVLNRMREKYGYVTISATSKYGYSHILDLTTFEISKSKSEKSDYTKPLFTRDTSVRCGDRSDIDKNAPEYDTFHFEFVTPILSSLEDLQLLFEFIGLYKRGCFISNSSAGYHVNMSLINTETNKPLNLYQTYFDRYFYPLYSEFEKEWYLKVRHDYSNYAKPLSKYETPYKNTVDKYSAVHRKSPYLYEMRLFGSNSDPDVLMKYTEMSLNLLTDAYKNWAQS